MPDTLVDPSLSSDALTQMVSPYLSVLPSIPPQCKIFLRRPRERGVRATSTTKNISSVASQHIQQPLPKLKHAKWVIPCGK